MFLKWRCQYGACLIRALKGQNHTDIGPAGGWVVFCFFSPLEASVLLPLETGSLFLPLSTKTSVTKEMSKAELWLATELTVVGAPTNCLPAQEVGFSGLEQSWWCCLLPHWHDVFTHAPLAGFESKGCPVLCVYFCESVGLFSANQSTYTWHQVILSHGNSFCILRVNVT